MKQTAQILLVLILSLTLTLQSRAYESGFTTSSLRFSTKQQNVTPNQILVIAQPAVNATENQVRIEAGSAWTINQTASTYQVSTSNLPGGVTAWPGITTAVSVSGNAIVFPSNDLNVGTQYGFYISSGAPTNPTAGSGDNYLWQIATQNTGSVIEVVDIPVEIGTASSNLTIAATVPVSGSYINLDLTHDVINPRVNQDEVITYTIEYGNTFSQAQDLILQMEWGLGTVAGEITPSVEMLEYVAGSASEGYDTTTPVIDTLARTITWTLTDFPANTTGESVTASFKVLASYKGTKTVTFTNSAQAVEPSGVSSNSKTLSYVFTGDPDDYREPDKLSCNAVCTGNSQCSSGYCHTPIQRCRQEAYPNVQSCSLATATPQATSIPGTTPSSKQNSLFTSVLPTQIGNNSVVIEVELSQAEALMVSLGLTPNNLVETRTSSSSSSHRIKITDLDPNTRYYFQIKNASGTQVSDIYTFKTATQTSQFRWSKTASTISSNTIPIWNGYRSSWPIIAAIGVPLELSLPFDSFQAIKSVSVSFVKKQADMQVLGVQDIHLQEGLPGVFSGYIFPPDQIGSYDLVMTVEDFSGNLETLFVAAINTSDPILVFEKDDLIPLSNIDVRIEKFNQRLKLFQPVEIYAGKNLEALTTSLDGKLLQNLPIGRYRATFAVNGYQNEIVEFQLGTEEDTIYPKIFLQKDTSLIGLISSIITSLTGIAEQCMAFGVNVFGSRNNFNLFTQVILLSTGLMTLIAFSAKTHVDLKHVPLYIWHQMMKAFKKDNVPTRYEGVVIDHEGKAVRGVELSFFDSDVKVVAQTKTGLNGRFSISDIAEGTEVLITKKGYRSKRLEVVYGSHKTVRITNKTSIVDSALFDMKMFATRLFSIVFESLLLLFFAGAIFSISIFGFQDTFLVIALTSFNLLTYLGYRSFK